MMSLTCPSTTRLILSVKFGGTGVATDQWTSCREGKEGTGRWNTTDRTGGH